ncbi:MAG: ATP-binding protein, partial [Nocardioides sp.]|nr:ATP-binding protein [Nocardioides sp.]
IRDAHDKYANQEVAFLLQRLENHAGLVILATNQRGNLDEAFLRRFQGSISFPPPSTEDRLRIWQKVFPSQVEIGSDVEWPAIARRFELTGAGIVNVAQHCAIETLARGMPPLENAVLEAAILRELGKEGRMV